MPNAIRFTLSLLVLFLLPTLPLMAQDATTATIEVEPAALTLEMGQTATLQARVVDDGGNELDIPLFFFARDRGALAIDRRTGEMRPTHPGTHVIVVRTRGRGQPPLMAEVTVEVPFPPIDRVVFVGAPEQMYDGTRVPVAVAVIDAAGGVRDDLEITISSSNADVATLDAFGHVVAHRTGRVTLMAAAEGVRGEQVIDVIVNPIARVELSGGVEQARTGDVIDFEAMAYDVDGGAVAEAPVLYSVVAQPDDNLGPAASGQIDADGRFVADDPGLYTIIATAGAVSTQRMVRITPRNVQQEVELIGHTTVSDVHTSDLWVWEGVDGRDYAVTGTWSANGEAYFWDVTDPTTPTIIDTVTVDARTVNDVKVSEDGAVCVISREGASNRRNGLVILDCSNPYDVTVLAGYDDELTGGVHNVFIYDQHIYALSAGQRYDIINIEDPTQPHRVGSFELDMIGHSIHDVWVEDGIAYSSNWSNGVYMVDVGNGIKGGSPSNPVVIGHYTYPSGWNHAAFPFKSEDTGKFYIIAGDEAFPYGDPLPGTPEQAAGWIHFLDFTDPDNPKEVARYEVPEAGTHNFWVEDDKLYIGYYNGGVRVVDISGDLMGDLYNQGREIARYMTFDPNGHVANGPMVWGVQPHKGNIFVGDHYSGLWVVKLKGDDTAQPGI